MLKDPTFARIRNWQFGNDDSADQMSITSEPAKTTPRRSINQSPASKPKRQTVVVLRRNM
jgi:hypothetical protein